MIPEGVSKLLEFSDQLHVVAIRNLSNEVCHIFTGVFASSLVISILQSVSELEQVGVEFDWVVELSHLDAVH